jgi:predicted transcriptional regulator
VSIRKGFQRNRVKLVVSLVPGIHLRELQRVVRLSFNSTRYHVDTLSRSGEIVRVEQEGYSRLYPVGIGEKEKTLYSILRNKTNRAIITALDSKKAGLTNKDLSDSTGLAKSTVSERLKQLLEEGIVETRSTSQERVYTLKDPDSLLPVLKNTNETFLERTAERFVGLWDI